MRHFVLFMQIATFGPQEFIRNLAHILSYSTSVILLLRKIFSCPSGKLSTEFTSPIAKSTSSGLSDTTFFARWALQFCCCTLLAHLKRFPKVRTGRPDHGRTRHFGNKIGFFSNEILLKNHLLCAQYLGFDWSGWLILIKSEILITMGMGWPVSSDKWKAPLSIQDV